MSSTGDAEMVAPLTAREQEILERLAGGLSDQQVAKALHLSPNTVRWYNRQLYSKLGVGSRTQAIARAQELGLLEGTRTAISPFVPRDTLPEAASPLVGRGREIAAVKELLQTSRLLTLTGVGGTGKTRLAQRVASDMRAAFADGVCFVDLAPLHEAEQVTHAIAAALDVHEHSREPLQETLKRALAGREMLLLIDNFEHVIGAAPLLSELLAATPALRLLVTSREALRLGGEQEFPVPALSLPSIEGVSARDITASEAGALFVQRARMVNTRFTLDDDSAPAIAQICTRLDGLPLAIELAAARCKLLTPQALLRRLESPLDLLTSGARDAPARQRTLRAAIEWSYDLLDDDEKSLFARLALFAGGCALDAIEEVCGFDRPARVLDTLASLVDKSLVRQEDTSGGEPRFVMLETIREYALERLESRSDAETLRQRHAAYYVKLAERAEPELRLAQQKRWFQGLETEQENIRAALEWSLSGDGSAGVRIAGALCWYWYTHGHHVEGLRWTQRLLPFLDDTPRQHHAGFLIGAAHMMSVRDLPEVKPLLERALLLSRELGDLHHAGYALTRLGYAIRGDPVALATVEEGLALFRELDHKPGIAHALNLTGEIARAGGDHQRARRAYEETLALSRQTGDRRGVMTTLLNLTFLARHEGNFEQAKELARQALKLARDLEVRAEMAECLAAFAGLSGVTGQPRLAARLLGASDIALERLGAWFDAPDRQEFDSLISAVRAQLESADFDALWNEGRQTSLEQAVARALSETVRVRRAL